MFEKIKKWYGQGLWTAEMVQNAVNKGVLTKNESDKIISGEKL